MKSAQAIFCNLLSLTAASLLLRTAGMSFQVYLSTKIGPAGIGLMQLIMSVYFLGATFAVSGFRLAVTRLAAEELSKGNENGVKQALKVCLGYSLVFGAMAALIMFCFAPTIATTLLGDERAILPLRVLALNLPFLAINAVLGGFYTANRRSYLLAAGLIGEQCVRITGTLICLQALGTANVEYACTGIALGAGLGEMCNCLLLFFFLRLGPVKKAKASSGGQLPTKALKIALPIALSAYTTSAARTVQQALIPRGLKKSGASQEQALGTYGVIQGMALPLLLFPGFLLNAATDLLVPELAECQTTGQPNRLNHIINKVFYLGLLFSALAMALFFRFANPLGESIYKNPAAGLYLKVLAPLAPVIYMDMLSDALLKGIGQQVSSMFYNIFESVSGAVLIYWLLPKYAIGGYIFVLLFTRSINLVLSINRLRKCVPLKIPFMLLGKMAFSLVNGLILANILLKHLGVTSIPLNFFAAGAACYMLLRTTGCITKTDLAWFKSLLPRR